MLFYEKMNMLMNLLEISNSALAKHLSLDPSYISRMRRGQRKPTFESEYFDKMILYFIKKIENASQYQSICKIVGLNGSLEDDRKANQDFLYRWLTLEAKTSTIKSLLSGVKNISSHGVSLSPGIDLNQVQPKVISNGKILYGQEGKRQGVKIFLERVLKNPKKQQIYLLSEENMDWMTSKPAFMKQWSLLLSEVIKGGNRITIIHNTNRSFDEMILAIKKWLPIYMTGAITPYYYPKIRDQVFKKTLFIAEDDIALVSDAIGHNQKNQANVLYTDGEMISVLVQTFKNYLSLCRPLMKIFSLSQWQESQDLLFEFHQEKAKSYFKSDSLSAMTLPSEILENLLKENKISAKEMTLHMAYQECFHKNIKDHEFIELIHLPEIETIVKNGLQKQVLLSKKGEPIDYDLELYYSHLKNILRLMDSDNFYHPIVMKEARESGYLLFVKEEVGSIIEKSGQSFVLFAINEKNMTLAFGDYFKESIRYMKSRQDSLGILKDYIQDLEDLLT